MLNLKYKKYCCIKIELKQYHQENISKMFFTGSKAYELVLIQTFENKKFKTAALSGLFQPKSYVKVSTT